MRAVELPIMPVMRRLINHLLRGSPKALYLICNYTNPGDADGHHNLVLVLDDGNDVALNRPLSRCYEFWMKEKGSHLLGLLCAYMY